MSYIIDQTIKKQVLDLIEWDEQQYAQFIYDCGLAYLQNVISNEYESITKSIISNEIFWNWWKINWEMRDQEFVEKMEIWSIGIEADREVYLNNNDPKILAKAIYLNGLVLQSSYAAMIQDLHKQVHISKLKVA